MTAGRSRGRRQATGSERTSRSSGPVMPAFPACRAGWPRLLVTRRVGRAQVGAVECLVFLTRPPGPGRSMTTSSRCTPISRARRQPRLRLLRLRRRRRRCLRLRPRRPRLSRGSTQGSTPARSIRRRTRWLRADPRARIRLDAVHAATRVRPPGESCPARPRSPAAPRSTAQLQQTARALTTACPLTDRPLAGRGRTRRQRPVDSGLGETLAHCQYAGAAPIPMTPTVETAPAG
jgi:hypothetical protein